MSRSLLALLVVGLAGCPQKQLVTPPEVVKPKPVDPVTRTRMRTLPLGGLPDQPAAGLDKP